MFTLPAFDTNLRKSIEIIRQGMLSQYDEHIRTAEDLDMVSQLLATLHPQRVITRHMPAYDEEVVLPFMVVYNFEDHDGLTFDQTLKDKRLYAYGFHPSTGHEYYQYEDGERQYFDKAYVCTLSADCKPLWTGNLVYWNADRRIAW